MKWILFSFLVLTNTTLAQTVPSNVVNKPKASENVGQKSVTSASPAQERQEENSDARPKKEDDFIQGPYDREGNYRFYQRKD